MAYTFPPSLDPRIVAETIRDSIRYAIARETPDFREGAIVVRFVNKSETSRRWLNLARSYPEPESTILDPKSGLVTSTRIDSTDLDFVDSVVKGGPKTRQAGWRGDPSNPKLACAGIALNMIEACAAAVVGQFGNASEDLPDDQLFEGCDNRPGAICMNLLLQELNQPDELIARGYFAVCGATDEENARIVRRIPNILYGLFEPEHYLYPHRLTWTFPALRLSTLQ